jgi:hypothetical protein
MLGAAGVTLVNQYREAAFRGPPETVLTPARFPHLAPPAIVTPAAPSMMPRTMAKSIRYSLDGTGVLFRTAGE